MKITDINQWHDYGATISYEANLEFIKIEDHFVGWCLRCQRAARQFPGELPTLKINIKTGQAECFSCSWKFIIDITIIKKIDDEKEL